MEKNETGNRITLLDTLRGFALFGICLAHMSQHYGLFLNGKVGDIAWLHNVDVVVQWIITYVISGKFFILFSFLFGLSFFIQMDRAYAKGQDFTWRFLWRLAILFVIGYIHSLFYNGDILTIYALLGIPMVLLYRLNSKFLIVISAFFLLGGVQLTMSAFPQGAKSQTNVLSKDVRAKAGGIYMKGDFKEMVTFNATERFMGKLKFQFGEKGRAYQTFAIFILGLLAGRLRLFEKVGTNRGFFVKMGWLSALLSPLFFLLKPAGITDIHPLLPILTDNLVNLSTAALILSLFVLAYPAIQHQVKGLTLYGRMGLTNYVIQSMVGVFLFYGVGLALHTHLGVTLSVVLGIVLSLLQIGFSKMWLKKFKYGPLEWLWRSGTYLKWQPMKICNF